MPTRRVADSRARVGCARGWVARASDASARDDGTSRARAMRRAPSGRARAPVDRYDPSDAATRRRPRDALASDARLKTTKRRRVDGTDASTGGRGRARGRVGGGGDAFERGRRASGAIGELPDDVWRIICARACDDVDETRAWTTNRKGETVDKRRSVYARRLEILFALRETNAQLRALMSGGFGEELFRRAFARMSDIQDAGGGVDRAPATMLWRHKAWFMRGLGCQGCDKHPTMRKPNWTFGVRMCKDCLMQRTVTTRELGEEEWTKHGTFEELTRGLPHDEIDGYSRFYGAYTLTRYWKNSVKKRVALLKRAKTPAEREAICAPPEAPTDAQLPEKQARERRKNELRAELELIGCELRNDSKLSKLFIDGFPNRRREREKWTAKSVAHRMAQMKYLHEYCAEFRDEIAQWREEINELRDDGWYGSDVVREVTGFRDFGAAVRDLADRWTRFPAHWPWLAPRATA